MGDLFLVEGMFVVCFPGSKRLLGSWGALLVRIGRFHSWVFSWYIDGPVCVSAGINLVFDSCYVPFVGHTSRVYYLIFVRFASYRFLFDHVHAFITEY